MKKIDDILEVEEIQGVLAKGTTEPVRCRLENGLNVVVKYMRNRFGQQVLVNELIGSSIADLLGVTVPEYGICNLSEEVIFNTNENEEISIQNAGLAFFTKDYSSSTPLVRSMLALAENKETEKIILFDHIVNNADRHDGNLILDIKKSVTLYVIDNSHIVARNIEDTLDILQAELEEESIFSNRILEKNKDVYELLCTGIGYSEERMLKEAERIKEILTSTKILEIKNTIPEIWTNFVGDDRINIIFEIINKRIFSICDIAEMIIRERRKL